MMLNIVKHNLPSVRIWQQEFLCGADRFLWVCVIWDVQNHSFPQKRHCWVSHFSCCTGYQKGWRAGLLASWAPTGLGRVSWQGVHISPCFPTQRLLKWDSAVLITTLIPEELTSLQVASQSHPAVVKFGMVPAACWVPRGCHERSLIWYGWRLPPEMWAGASAERSGIYPSPGTV